MGRLVEAHADAIAICVELSAQAVGTGQRWGVWAAGPADRLRADRTNGHWRVEGTKDWCSGASLLTHALVDAATPHGQQLFAVALDDPGVVIGPPTWEGPGMARSDTRTTRFERVSGVPVGRTGEYLSRSGFWPGAIGVAACWHGGTAAVARPLLVRARQSSDPHLLAHLGAVHVALQQDSDALGAAAWQVDERPGDEHAVLALSVRSTVERNAVEVMDRLARALGPGPLARDGVHAGRVADLTVYIRQHHAERDLEQIGRQIAEVERPWAL